jgi:hypothetical protein
MKTDIEQKWIAREGEGEEGKSRLVKTAKRPFTDLQFLDPFL